MKRRRFYTHQGEEKQVGRNLGLPGNYALYLVVSGIIALLLWTLLGLFSGYSTENRLLALSVSLLPPLITSIVVFGLLLGKPPHFAKDWWESLGRDSFYLQRHGDRKMNPAIQIIREEEIWTK